MANEQRLVVAAPEVTPRKFGLYSVADVATAEPHSLMGIEYEKNFNCNWGNVRGTATWCSTTAAKTKTEGYDGTTGFDQFQLYSLDECAGINEFRQAKDRAVKKFALGEERGVEDSLNTTLKADTNGVDLTGTPTDLRKSLAVLEEWLDDNYAGVGTILMSREAGSLIAENDRVSRHGNRLETNLGNLVAASAMFGDGGAESTSPTAGQTVLWAVGSVVVRRGQMYVSDPYMIATGGTDEVQTVSITGTPTGGNFTLTFNGQTTGNIAHNANAAAVQAALVALSNVDTGEIVVTGTNPNFTLTFHGQYDSQPVSQVTATAALTGGTTPGVTTATTTQGVQNSTDNSFQTLAENSYVTSYDCAVASIIATLA